MPTLSDVYAALSAPFPSHLIELKPGATTQTKERALALAYADARVYQERLDQAVGPHNWQVRFEMTAMGVVCTLEVCGIVKADVGDFPLDVGNKPTEHKTTTAAAQAFKRACAQFGIGRYLYALPRLWADYDAQHKRFVDPDWIVMRLYQSAGLAAFITEQRGQVGRAAGSAASSASNGTNTHTPTNGAATHTDDEPTSGALTEKLRRARAALAVAEAATASPPRPRSPQSAPDGAQRNSGGRPASEKQLRYLIRLLSESSASADELDALAHQVGLTVDTLTHPEQLATIGLSATSASTLIQELLALQDIHAA